MATRRQDRPESRGQAGERVLICWVGKADINSALRRDRGNPGPIRMLLERTEPFTRAFLLLNGRQDVRQALTDWFTPFIAPERLELRRIAVTDLTDHVLVSGVIMAAVDYAIRTCGLPADGTGIHFHLSPGTPTTHALFALLGSTRYPGVHMYQTRQGTLLGQSPEVLDVPPLSAGGTGDANGESGGEAAPSRRTPRPYVNVVPDGSGLAPNNGPLPARPAGPRTERRQPQRRAPACDPVMPWPNRTPIPDTARPAQDEPPSICAALGDIYRRMEQVSQMPLPVLLLGEDGCGRSRLAGYIHRWSGRSGEFARMNCAGLDDETFHCTLFGYPRGDGRTERAHRDGVLRAANGGTLFLENVERLTLPQQTAVMRLLAPRGETVVSLPAQSGAHPVDAHLRVIATASPDLADRIRLGLFSSDLYYRLAGVAVRLPSVRAYSEPERVKLLLISLLDLQNKEGRLWSFDGDAWQALIDEPWPGNLREIYHTIRTICLLSQEGRSITREEVLQRLSQAHVAVLPAERSRLAAERLGDGHEPGSMQALEAEADRRLTYERLADIAEEAVAGTYGRLHPGEAYARRLESAPLALPGRDQPTRPGKKAKTPFSVRIPTAIHPGSRPLAEELGSIRQAVVRRAFELSSGDEAEMARLLGVSRRRAGVLLGQLSDSTRT